MVGFSQYFPGALAGLLDETRSSDSLAYIKACFDAFESAQRSPHPLLKKMVKRCFLGQTPYLWLHFYFSRTGWKCIPPQAKVMVDSISSGILQSKIIEDAASPSPLVRDAFG